MSQLKYLVEKEFKQISRNAIIPKMIVLYPVLVLLIFPWAINFEVKNIKIHVVDNAKSTYSQRLINKIDASAYFILTDISTGYNAAIGDIERDKSDIILEIPVSFDTDMVKERHANVMISANAVNSTQGLLGNNYLTQIINDFSQELRTELFPAATLSNAPHIDVVTDFRYNKRLDYKSFMLPAFIVLMITLICGILPSLNIVIEKETGTIQQINATPVSKFNFILAKLIPYWIIGLIILTLSFFLTWIIYGLLPSGSFVTLYISAIIFLLGVTGLGIIISNYSETLQQSMFLVMFFILIIILLSGMFTPISAMPEWAQVIAHANPLTYFIEIMRLVYLKGSSLSDLLRPLMWLAGFSVLFNTWAVLSYKKRG
ncbi:putative multidrug ABC transporter permease YbhR [bioreactor metagenome]|uniref:Putative multidrug ABC transporter permease YbhR n=1 Tax=bioreactor metagenome TaxID=1076179 RepID=A0A644ZBB6_9ZZZZ